MTAANEVECPCCHSTHYFRVPDSPWCFCDCGCRWNRAKRRAQPAELSTDDYMRLVEWMRSKPRRRANTAFTAGMLRSIAYAVEHAEQPATGGIAATCETTSNLPYTVGQPAEAADQKAIAESAWEAGYISAQQDERYPPAPPLPDHVYEMIMANARARGGMDESEAVTLLREVYDHGENFELHERIRVFLGIKD